MSTFGGLIQEFRGISVDQFQADNLKSTIYFLSHVHTDHMRGFDDLEFLNRIANKKLYCYSSECTTKMLRNWFPANAENFLGLTFNDRHYLKPLDEKHFTVTLLPAGHCPGSVMFIFENDENTVLYTGDFRLNVSDFKLFKGIYTSVGTLKNISKIYMDTTFMLKRYAQFPPRAESLNNLCNLIGEWIEKSPKHIVNLQTNAYYGGEYIYLEIYKRFNIRVHVSQRVQESYKYFPNMDKCITLASDSQIHAHCSGYKKICCNYFDNSVYARKIKITAWFWSNWSKGSEITLEDKNYKNFFRVCYTSHSSCEELQEFIRFLRPKEIEPNVVPQNLEDREEMYKLINNCLDQIQKEEPAEKRFKAGNNFNFDFDSETENYSDYEEEKTLKLMKAKEENAKVAAQGKISYEFDLSILD